MSSDFPAIDAWTEWFEKYREELSDAALVHVGALRHAFVSGWLDGRNRLLLQLEDADHDDGSGDWWMDDVSRADGPLVPRRVETRQKGRVVEVELDNEGGGDVDD